MGEAEALPPWDGGRVSKWIYMWHTVSKISQGAWWPPRNMLLPHLSYNTNFGHSRSNYTSIILENPKKFDHLRPAVQGHSRSSAPRSASYNSLLVFHTNYSPISYRFWEKGWYLLNFPTPLHFTSQLRGFPFEFCNGVWVEKTRMTPLPESQKKYDDMSIRLDTVPVLDRQTDGQKW